MNARSTVGLISTLLLGSAVVSFIAYTARAEGDDFIGEAPRPLPEPAETMPELPDVILITVDTLRADHLGVYGYLAADTPNIDAMGRSGVVFANATVPLPRTTPGLASLLTGLDTEGHGSREVWEPVKVDKGQRLAEVFSDAGYVTLGLSANSAAGTRQGLAVGFDKFLDHRNVKRKYKRTDADMITDAALDLVDGIDPEAPLFLWVHYVDPHWPYRPPKKWKSPKAKKCRDLQKKIKAKKLTLGNMFANTMNLATDAYDDCVALYDSEVAFNDSEIGVLIEGLQERGRWEDSLRVFTADHGENMGEDGLYFAHGPSLADAALRVPLIFAGPTIPAGRFDGGIARIEDVAPTLVELAGIGGKRTPEYNGSSLVWRWDDDEDYPMEVAAYVAAESGGALHPDTTMYVVSGRKRSKYCYNEERYSMCFDGAARKAPTRAQPVDRDDEEDDDDVHAHEHEAPEADEAPESPQSELDFEFYDRQEDPLEENPVPAETVPQEVRDRLMAAKKRWSPEATRLRAVRDTDYKLVAYPQMDGGYRLALYDLHADPTESTDVKDAHPRVFKRMKSALDDWGSSMPTFVSRERSESELDELRALGYVQ